MQRKKRKFSATVAAVPNYLPSLANFKNDNCQRIGFVIHHVVTAWNIFAKHIGFSSVEQMIAPYIIFNSESFCYDVIHKREDGYAPLSQRKSFGHNNVAVSTKASVDNVAWCQNDEVDGNLRVLAKFFLNDITNLVFNDFLYEMDDTAHWEQLSLFDQNPDMIHYPKRFTSFDMPLWTPIRMAMIGSLPGGEMGAPQNIAVCTAKKEAEVVEIFMQDHGHEQQQLNKEATTSDKRDPPPDADSGTVAVEEVGILPPHAISVPTTLNALKDAEKEMEKHFSIYGCDFSDFVDLDLLRRSTSASPLGRVQLVLTDPPYNIRANANRTNSDHDVLSQGDMKETARLIAKLLCPGGHFILFCSFKQFRQWLTYFKNIHRTTESGSKEYILEVDNVPLHFVRAASHPTGDIRGYRTSPMPIAEYAIHGLKRGLSHEENVKRINLVNFGYVPSRYPAHKNVIDNVPGMAAGEALRWNRIRSAGQGAITERVRPEQKSRALLKELISRYSQPRDIVVDLFAGTFSTALACMELPGHRRFLGCESDAVCYAHAKHNAVIHFIRCVLEENIDIELTRQNLIGKFKLVLNTLPSSICRSRYIWSAPPGMPQYQTLPAHLAYILSSLWKNANFAQIAKAKPIHEWPRQMQGKLTQENPDTLLACDAMAQGLITAKSTIKHPLAGNGVFAARMFQEGEKICYFYGTLVYHDLSKRSARQATYGDGLLGVTVDRFKTTSMQISVTGDEFRKLSTPGSRGQHIMWITPAPFCVGGVINDARYRPEDLDFQLVQDGVVEKRTRNVIARLSTGLTSSKAGIQDYKVLSIVASRPIARGEELLMDYGSEYDTWSRAPVPQNSRYVVDLVD